MPRNVEIKARARDFEKQSRLAEALAKGAVERMVQEDTFFNVPAGRLKLRSFENGSGELIHYERENSRGPKESRYVTFPTNDPVMLKNALSNALGVRAVIRKRRTVYFCGQTRIHFDRVDGLGEFIEFEVVLKPGEESAHGIVTAKALMSKLGIEQDDLIAEAYVDLLSATAH